MAKSNPLEQAMRVQKSVPAPVVVDAGADVRPVKANSSREGRVLVGGFFSPDVQKALRIIAAEEGKTIQALLAEGINTVLAKHGKPQLAEASGRIIRAA